MPDPEADDAGKAGRETPDRFFLDDPDAVLFDDGADEGGDPGHDEEEGGDE